MAGNLASSDGRETGTLGGLERRVGVSEDARCGQKPVRGLRFAPAWDAVEGHSDC